MSDVDLVVQICGEGACGKTSMCVSYDTGHFPSDYLPTVYENSSVTVLCDNKKQVKMQILDFHIGYGLKMTQEKPTRLKLGYFHNVDVYIFVYSICDRRSFEKIEEVYYPEIREHRSFKHLILVGNKHDLRQNPEVLRELQERNENMVSEEEGRELAKKLKIEHFFETSAKTQYNLRKLFETAIHITLFTGTDERGTGEGNKECSIL